MKFKNIMITNSSPAFQYWLEPPATVYRKYYLFDVRNPQEIKDGTNKPWLVEKGKLNLCIFENMCIFVVNLCMLKDHMCMSKKLKKEM